MSERQTAKEIMDECPPLEYVRQAIRLAGVGSHKRLPRWSYVADIFGQGSGVAQALCLKYGYDPDQLVGDEWTDVCPTCRTEFEE